MHRKSACACGGGCPRCQSALLQTKSLNSSEVAPTVELEPAGYDISHADPTATSQLVGEVLQSPGKSLDVDIRARMESRLGYDFGSVRVHTDARAAASSRAVKARAYTVGHNIVFGAGENNNGKLLAHELVHVVQQRAVDPLVHESNPFADRSGRNVAAGSHVHLSKIHPAIQRVELTYDDGPDSSGHTRAILNTLIQTGARATFYVVGRRVIEGDNWRVVFDIAASGNWLGNHAFDWNNQTDNHIFMQGSMEERARKILITEWAIRDALVRGKNEAVGANTWNAIPQAHRNYIDDVIAHGTGRFRTPGFRSHIYSSGGIDQQGAISLASRIAVAAGLRAFVASDSVDIDPEDWRSGRTQTEIGTSVRSDLSSPTESILLHSRIGATAAATPAIIADIRSRTDDQGRPYSFTAPAQGQLNALRPGRGFAGLSSISDPPTHNEIMTARRFLLAHLDLGGVILGETAIAIFQMAQAAGRQEVLDFMRELETTPGPPGTGYLGTNFLYANQSYRLFYEFLRSWINNVQFPRGPGVTY